MYWKKKMMAIIRVIVDTRTGVHDIMTAGAGGSSITPLLDSSGNAVIDTHPFSRWISSMKSRSETISYEFFNFWRQKQGFYPLYPWNGLDSHALL